MASTLLQKFLGGRGDESSSGASAFSLPGAVHEQVQLLLVDSGQVIDLLFAIPFVTQTRALHPEARIGLLCDERTSHLAISSGQFHDIIVYEEEQLKPGSAGARKLEEVLGADSWDIAVLVGQHPDPKRERLAAATGAALRVGSRHDRAFPSLNLELKPPAEGRHPYLRTVTWSRLLGVPLEDVPLRWPLDLSQSRQVAQLIHFNKPRKDQLLIGVDPGVGLSGTVLAAENLAFLANHLASHVRSKTMLLSADPQAERIDALAGHLRGELLDLPRPTLKETVLMLAHCDLFLAGNTELFHFAVALEVPTLGIFTEADGDGWLPPDAQNVELIRSVPGERLVLSDVMERVDRLISG